MVAPHIDKTMSENVACPLTETYVNGDEDLAVCSTYFETLDWQEDEK